MRAIIISMAFLVLLNSPLLFADDGNNAKFQLITLALRNKSVVLIRGNKQTGEGWYRLGSKWNKGVEEKLIDSSLYTFQAHAYDDNAWILVRLDEASGKIWTLQGEVWRLVLDSPDAQTQPQHPSQLQSQNQPPVQAPGASQFPPQATQTGQNIPPQQQQQKLQESPLQGAQSTPVTDSSQSPLQ